jgi:uncharacterized protein YgbK (DUF1537 family)
MILVIADDISGAAEIAAAGRTLGLTAQIQIKSATSPSAELVVIDTDTRYREINPRPDIENTLANYDTAPVEWYYKKVDSVLRGNISTELRAMMQILKKSRTILAPANPTKGRVISNGQYFIDGRPLNETDFANDPDYPAASSRVIDLLNVPSDCPIHTRTPETYTGHEHGIIVADVNSVKDLVKWTEYLDEHTLAAGGSDFFRAIVNKKLSANRIAGEINVTEISGKKLFVCGSTSQTSKKAVTQAANSGIPVCFLPDGLFENTPADDSLIKQWADEVLKALSKNDHVIIAIAQKPIRDSVLAENLRMKTAALVKIVINSAKIRELFIEGGATAEAVLKTLGCIQFDVLAEYAPGVVQMRIAGKKEQYVTIKPGSYPWPEEIWTHCKKGASNAT